MVRLTSTALAVLVMLLVAPAIAQESCEDYDGRPEGEGPTAGMIRIEGGSFLMGSERRDNRPEEGPLRERTVGSFWIDQHEVTNAQFAAFVEETGYRTIAETGLDPDDHPHLPPALLQPGSMVFAPPQQLANLDDPTQWWRYVPGANWREPLGRGSSIEGYENHPVVHIAYEDALAYAHWRGGDLPSEAEWEYAARGGLAGADYTWGNTAAQESEPKANTWQGAFPAENKISDGWLTTAPVACYAANGYGLYDMAGNVWEYTLDSWVPRPGMPETIATDRVTVKGGSWLCAPNYCARFRPAARQPQEHSLGSNHIGFRIVLREN